VELMVFKLGLDREVYVQLEYKQDVVIPNLVRFYNVDKLHIHMGYL
jgi:hypothetical protein